MPPDFRLTSIVIPILTSPFGPLIYQAMSFFKFAAVSEQPTSNATVGNLLPWPTGFHDQSVCVRRPGVSARVALQAAIRL